MMMKIKKIKMPALGDYLTSINKTKINIIRESEDPRAAADYPAFLVRRLLSYHLDSVLFANEVNKLPNLDSQLQYEYLLNVLPKKNRYAKTFKPETPEN